MFTLYMNKLSSPSFIRWCWHALHCVSAG